MASNYRRNGKGFSQAGAWQCVWAGRHTATILRVFILLLGHQKEGEGGRGKEGGREVGRKGGREVELGQHTLYNM